MKKWSGLCNYYLYSWGPANPGVVYTCSHRYPHDDYLSAWSVWSMFGLFLSAFVWLDLRRTKRQDIEPGSRWGLRYLGFITCFVNTYWLEVRDQLCLTDMHCYGQGWLSDVLVHLVPLVLWLVTALLWSWELPAIKARMEVWVCNGGWSTDEGLRIAGLRLLYWVMMAASLTLNVRILSVSRIRKGPYDDILQVGVLLATNPAVVYLGHYTAKKWLATKEEVVQPESETASRDAKGPPALGVR